MLFQFSLWSPYVYIHNDAAAFSLVSLRYVDLRAQLLDSERLMDEAFDQYTFIRDAYLQHRNYLITGVEQETDDTYLDEEGETKATSGNGGDTPSDYVDE